ncbi:hypothetical protein AYL99_11945 [Fonsecaea erecta]|uniref:Thioredoxin domain-containing protein n=1 Tax=Fonsecaea erecta TaxID=1367422 RepID=A0A178Z400_9EURO|nr:hypothetical protein AYL99_11945 [Fonsecaea erecta]OAP53923.1 hypothetical protein AYL99_11945 [Fonsecaea erecta]
MASNLKDPSPDLLIADCGGRLLCRLVRPMQKNRPRRSTFSATTLSTTQDHLRKIDTHKLQDNARSYGIRARPTFMVSKNTRPVRTIQGADREALSHTVKELASAARQADPASFSSSRSPAVLSRPCSGSTDTPRLYRAAEWLSPTTPGKGALEVPEDDQDDGGLKAVECRSNIFAAKPPDNFENRMMIKPKT